MSGDSTWVNPSVTFGDSSPFRRACNKAPMPPLKGEVPAVRAVGFKQSPQPLECGGWGRVLSGDSQRNRALPGADLGRFNLWRPMVVERMRGSNRPSALPTRKAEEFGDSNLWSPNSSIEPAAATGRRPCRL